MERDTVYFESHRIVPHSTFLRPTFVRYFADSPTPPLRNFYLNPRWNSLPATTAHSFRVCGKVLHLSASSSILC